MEIRYFKSVNEEVLAFFDTHFSKYSVDTIHKDSTYEQWIYVAYIDNKIIGAIKADLMWGVVHIDLLIIEPAHRKNGIGTLLYSKIMEHSNKFHMMTVETFDFQAPQYWLNKGFQVDFIRGGYNGNTLYYFSKRLDSKE